MDKSIDVSTLAPAITPGDWIADRDDVFSSGGAAYRGGNIVCESPSDWSDSMAYWPANRAAIRQLPRIIDFLLKDRVLTEKLRRGEYNEEMREEARVIEEKGLAIITDLLSSGALTIKSE
jgi:hypothetical protein